MPGAGEGRWGARREATGLGMEDEGAWVEGSATEGAWVGREARGVGAGREAGLIRWSWAWVSKKCAMHATDGQVVAETAGLLRRAHGCTTSIIAGCSGSVHK